MGQVREGTALAKALYAILFSQNSHVAENKDKYPHTEHPHGLNEKDFDSIFTKDKHIIFNFHGYPWLVHRLTYSRANRNIHVRGYKEEGTITTPFDLRVQNDIDRFHLVIDVIDRLPQLGSKGDYLARAVSPAPDKTDQLWTMESILHSSLTEDPSGMPLSNQARLYHCPSQAFLSMFTFNCCACFLHSPANPGSLYETAISANRRSMS